MLANGLKRRIYDCCKDTYPSLCDSILEGSFLRSSISVENPTWRSAPAQNAGPDPVTTTALTRSSVSKCWYAAIISSIICAVTALNWRGRFSFRMTTLVTVGKVSGKWEMDMVLKGRVS